MKPKEVEILVFQLDDIVFFPTSVVPLNIFEPRYIALINDALEREVPITLTFYNPLENALPTRPMICGIGNVVLLERKKDGTMTVLIKGLGKVALGEVLQRDPFVVCKARMIPENNDLKESNVFMLNRMRKLLFKWIEDHIQDEAYKNSLLASIQTPEQVVESLTMCVIKDVDMRQTILEMDNINDRVGLVGRAVLHV